MARSFIDTNVLIYARDLREPAKRERAIELIHRTSASGELFLSAQVLNEFSAACLRLGVPIGEVSSATTNWCELANVLPLEATATVAALGAVERHRLSFWDALIWATARDAKVPVVLSEDFQHGRELDGVTSENPFIDLTAER